MMDPSGVVRTIPILEPFLFEAPLTFKVYHSKRSLCTKAPRMNSTIKSAKICPLIPILDSYLMTYGFNFVAYLAIHPVAYRFSTILFRGCSGSMTI